jgi:thioredoxin-like negative regulator of GroEL
MVHRLEAEYWGKVDFVYLDREASMNADIVRQFDIRYQPVFILVDADGNEITRWTVLDEDGFRQQLDTVVQ